MIFNLCLNSNRIPQTIFRRSSRAYQVRTLSSKTLQSLIRTSTKIKLPTSMTYHRATFEPGKVHTHLITRALYWWLTWLELAKLVQAWILQGQSRLCYNFSVLNMLLLCQLKCLNYFIVEYLLLCFLEVQSNSVITNPTGPSTFVRYNRDIAIAVKVYVVK